MWEKCLFAWVLSWGCIGKKLCRLIKPSQLEVSCKGHWILGAKWETHCFRAGNLRMEEANSQPHCIVIWTLLMDARVDSIAKFTLTRNWIYIVLIVYQPKCEESWAEMYNQGRNARRKGWMMGEKKPTEDVFLCESPVLKDQLLRWHPVRPSHSTTGNGWTWFPWNVGNFTGPTHIFIRDNPITWHIFLCRLNNERGVETSLCILQRSVSRSAASTLPENTRRRILD